MKNSPYAVDGSKGVLGDLLIIATVFVFLVAFSSTALAVADPHYYVAVFDNKELHYYRAVNGTQITGYFRVQTDSNEASFVCLIQLTYPLEDFFAVGYMEGWTPVTPSNPVSHWHATPYYFVDRRLYGEYDFHDTYQQANVGEIHSYRVGCFILSPPYLMFAIIDASVIFTETGYLSTGNKASGQTETHNTLDQMNSHFNNMKAGTSWLTPNEPFHDDYAPPPSAKYHLNLISQTEWTATGP